MKLIVMCLLSMPLMAMAQVQITSATYNQDTRGLHIAGNIDPSIQALVFTTIKTIEAHGGGTVARTEWLRATVEGYHPYWHPSVKILDGSSHFDLKYTLRNYTLSADSVTPGVYFGEGDFASPLGETFTNIVQMCPPKDWTIGAPTTTQCMPEPTQSVFDAHKKNGVVPWLVEPAEWCRWEPSDTASLYWPRLDTDCIAGNREQGWVDSLAEARTTAIAHGASATWIHPTSTVLTVEFTDDAINGTGGAFSSAGSPGHTLLSTQIADTAAPAGYCTIGHEWQHANYQYSAFPSMTGDFWGSGVWPEALATLGMMDMPTCDGYHYQVHGPWDSRWIRGYENGEERHRRQLALFFEYLRDKVGIADGNWYEWQLNQHAALLGDLGAGVPPDEIAALHATVPAHGLDYWWLQFVQAYNLRNADKLPDIGALGESDHFPVLPNASPTMPAVGNGMLEGDTRTFTLTENKTIARTFQTSTRCPPETSCYEVHKEGRAGQWQCSSGDYVGNGGSSLFGQGTYTVTLASLSGRAHARELTFARCFTPPCDPWPPQDTNDPWQGESCQ